MTTYLDEQVRAASHEMGAGVEASITFRHHGAVLRAASSSPEAARCDQAEVRMDEGPCLEAMDRLDPVAVPDVRDERRWPRWSARTLEEGFLSCVALPVRVATETVLAINYYGCEAGPLHRPWGVAEQRARAVAVHMRARLDVASADVLGTPGAVTLAGDDAVVDRAVGVTMQSNGIDAGAAYVLLGRAATGRGVPLEQVAHGVLAALTADRAGHG